MSRITGGAHPFPLARSRTAVASRDEVTHYSPAGGRHDRRGGEGEREEARRDVSSRSRRVVDEAHQHQPTHSSRSQSTRAPNSHRELRPIHTQPSASHRTPVALPSQQSVVQRHRVPNPSRTVSHSSSSSSSQSSISSASSGASDSSSPESPVQATTSWKDWALGRGGRAVGEMEEDGRPEAVVVELETKEDLSDLIAPPPKSTIWNIVSTAAHAAIHRGGAGESEFIGDDDGPPTPVGGEGKLERAMKRWYVENAASRSELPDWLFPPSALAPPPPPPAVESTKSSRPSNDSVSRSRSLSSPARPPRNLLRDVYDSAPPLPTARKAAVPLSTGGASSTGGGRATERLRAMRLERAPTRVREPEPMVMQEDPVPRRSGGDGGRTREEERGGRGGGGGGEERRRPVGLPSGPGGLPSGPGGRRAAGRF